VENRELLGKRPKELDGKQARTIVTKVVSAYLNQADVTGLHRLGNANIPEIFVVRLPINLRQFLAIHDFTSQAGSVVS
jgi:hypothetical protein